jgi:SAM-dependent methyltransferase
MNERVETRADIIAPEFELAPELSPRKRGFRDHAERTVNDRQAWVAKNASYYEADRNYMRFLVQSGSRVLDLGCGDGSLLAAVQPSYGVGVDFSPSTIEFARKQHPNFNYFVADAENSAALLKQEGPFDYIVLSDTIGMLDDIEVALKGLHELCDAETRIVVAYYSSLWEPLTHIATSLGLRMPQPQPNLISNDDFLNIMDLAELEIVSLEMRQLVPFRMLGLGTFINKALAPLPLIRRLCLRTYVVARSKRMRRSESPSTTIVIPCRNESGNIERAIVEMPRFGPHQEILFVEGNSSDDTLAECKRVQHLYADQWDIKVFQQDGKGKGDAVRKGFENATGDVLMILDADLTVPPSALSKFYDAIATNKGEVINGTRLIYPMEDEAMRPLNVLANRTFARIFSYLLNQRYTDTLCGTKVLWRTDYQRIARARGYFGEFDPFGDFDLIFGAAKQSLRVVELPVHYGARTYGETQISRFRDGWLLLKMVAFAFKKMKAI